MESLTRDGGQPFFGEPWPSGVCDEGVQHPTPVGVPCLLCMELIEDGDRGNWMGSIDAAGQASVQPVHRECSFRSVMGDVDHLEGRCYCHTGVSVDSGKSYREESLETWEWVQTHWGQEEMVDRIVDKGQAE